MMNNRSFLSKIAEYILRKTKPDYMTSEEKIDEFLENCEGKEFSTVFHTEEFNNVKLVTFGREYHGSHVIIYVHGGAYVNQMNYQHTLYCYILSKVLKTRIIAPVYPLTPKYNYKDCYKLVSALYVHTIEHYEHVTLMGDSAGGGFVLSFCQYLKKLNYKNPDNVIVFSPWVDLSLKNNYDDKDDPILGNIGLKKIGEKWSGNIDTRDYRVSPLYGDTRCMPRTLIFVGTNEIFYKDIIEYYEKLNIDCVNAEIIIGKGLFHIYPLFPIPEAWKTLKKIKKEIKYSVSSSHIQ